MRLASSNDVAASRRTNGFRGRRRQVHIWLSELEYEWLRAEAKEVGESLSGLIRNLINAHLAQPLRPSRDERAPANLHRDSRLRRKL